MRGTAYLQAARRDAISEAGDKATMTEIEILKEYWSGPEVEANLLICVNVFGALLLGLVVGYERSYHGRAAGMRTYGLVCMASAALTAMVGYPGLWYGGIHPLATGSDPTRVVQGIVTGVGFLGAGMIMKEGLSISGLTTAASIWASSAIGIMVGVGFHSAAALLALLSVGCMMGVAKIEAWLPSRPAIGIDVRFRPNFPPSMAALDAFAQGHGYEVAPGSLSITGTDGAQEWHFVALAMLGRSHSGFPELSAELVQMEGVSHYRILHARN